MKQLMAIGLVAVLGVVVAVAAPFVRGNTNACTLTNPAMPECYAASN